VRTGGAEIGAIAALAIAVRCLAVWQVGDYRDPVTWEYGEIARNLVEGHGFVITSDAGTRPYEGFRSWLPPGYPLVVAAFMLVPASALWQQVAQAVLSTVSCVLLFALGRRLLGAETGVAGAAPMAVYPPLVVKVGRIDPITIEILLSVAALLAVVHFHDTGRRSSAIAAGLLLALSGLTRPVLLVSFGVLTVFWFAWRRVGRVQWLWIAIPLILGLMPWAVRNYAVHGEIVPVATNGAGTICGSATTRWQPGRPMAWTGSPSGLRCRMSS